MADAASIWKVALPVIRTKVTGVGVWTALNACLPIAYEDDVLVVGLRGRDLDLAGHLKMVQTKRIMDIEVSKVCGKPTSARVIEGDTEADWERAKRRDAEAVRLKEHAESKVRAEISARTSWDGIYEQLSRRYAQIQNKSLPQNRAKFLIDGIQIVSDALKTAPPDDDPNERNFGRCIERIAQYCEMPSTLVAMMILEKAGK
jgi:hypothetical protein